MRILFLSTWFPYPFDNGAKLRVFHLVRALAKKHEVTLVSFAFGTARPDEPGSLRALCTQLHAVPLDPFAVNRASTFRTLVSTRPVASRPIAAMSQLVANVLQGGAFDAVIASTEIMTAYALQVNAGAARVLEDHNSLTRWRWERHQGAEHLLQRLRYWVSWQKRRRYDTRFFRHFDLITMVCQGDHDATVAGIGRGPTRVQVIPNGVDCDYNRLGLAQPQPNSLVYNGALTYTPNYDAMSYFLRAIFPLIKQDIADVSLIITGSTTGVDHRALRLDESVLLSGYVDDVRSLVASASVCVVPLRQGGGTRLKILEAMALGTPVVSTSKGAEGLDVVHGEHLLIADEPDRFAAYTLELMRDSEQRERLAQNARRLVEQKYDWEEIGRQFTSIVEDVVRAKNVWVRANRD